jgi:hypothetical protein
MFEMKYEKLVAEQYIAALSNGHEIEAPQCGWTTDAIACLAGVCAAINGSALRKLNLATNHFEHLEADATEAGGNSLAAVSFCHTVAADLLVGLYDQFYEGQLVFAVGEREGEQRVHPIAGFKDGWDR